MPLVSIIVPCYNYGWLLAETLDSVLAQTHQAWQCIIVDDGSTDSTRALSERYLKRDARFKYVYQTNAGLSAARNTGLKHATGSYVQFLDADDLLAPRKLETQVALFETQPEVDIVYGDVRYFMHEAPHVLSRSLDMQDNNWMVPLFGKGQQVLEILLKHNQMVVNAPLLRMELIKRVGVFQAGLRSLEDWEYWLRCAISGATFHYQGTADAWAYVRVHTSSLSQNRTRMVECMQQVREQIKKPLRKLGAEQALEINHTAQCEMLEQHGLEEFHKGHRWAGMRFFWQLAIVSRRYSYYLSSALYWLKNSSGSKPI